jgi:hypothetical protein
VVAAIVILFLLVILLGCGFVALFNDSLDAEKKIGALEHEAAQLSHDMKVSHERLVDDLWRRASVEADREIVKARARGRDY